MPLLEHRRAAVYADGGDRRVSHCCPYATAALRFLLLPSLTHPASLLTSPSPQSCRSRQDGPDKRRMILDAAVRVFARQGFHACRVADIADEAGVAYGLVYHYFTSKDDVLDTLFLDRWEVMLRTIREVDAQES